MAINKGGQQPLFVGGAGDCREPFVYHALFDITTVHQFFLNRVGIPQENPDFLLEVSKEARRLVIIWSIDRRKLLPFPGWQG